MILYIMNQVYSATITIIYLPYDNILVIKHALYICFIFSLPLRMIILVFYGEYIVHLHCQWERRVIYTKIVYICFTQVYVYGIVFFRFIPFSIPFRFPFRVLVTPIGDDHYKQMPRVTVCEAR